MECKCNELTKKYPKIFANPLIDGGCTCGNGWYDLLNELCDKIENICQEHGLPKEKYPVVVQVKEKFGGLRFYINSVDNIIFEQLDKLIMEYEKKSCSICEKCGADGKIIEKSGWLQCLCRNCREQN